MLAYTVWGYPRRQVGSKPANNQTAAHAYLGEWSKIEDAELQGKLYSYTVTHPPTTETAGVTSIDEKRLEGTW